MRVSVRGAVPRRVAGALVAAVLLGGGSAACGESTGSEAVAEGSPRTSSTAKDSPRTSSAPQDSPRTPSATEDAAEDAENAEHAEALSPAAAVARAAEHAEDVTSLRYRITGTAPEKGPLRAEASMRTHPLAMSMEMTTPGRPGDGRTEVRFAGDVMYVGGSAVDSAKLGGRHWMRADPAVWGRGAVDNNSYGVLPRQVETAPAAQWTLLTGSRDLRRIGTATIGGTRTTRYRGTVTLSGLSAARDAAGGAAARKRWIHRIDQLVALHLDAELTMDLWLDEGEHARRYRMRGEGYDPRGGHDGEPVDLTVTVLGVNRPVTVEVPPTGDTADLGARADALPAD